MSRVYLFVSMTFLYRSARVPTSSPLSASSSINVYVACLKFI